MNSDKPLFRNGRVVLKIRTLPDGSVLMFKPFVIKPEHIMRLTDAPGWDKEHVDAVFTDGVVGGLRYTQDIVQYDISIEDFRKHAFERASASYETQYHVHRKYYRATGLRTVDPKRESFSYKPSPEIPKKITFGEWVPCPHCKSTGVEPEKKKERCGKCHGLGYQKWVSGSGSATS